MPRVSHDGSAGVSTPARSKTSRVNGPSLCCGRKKDGERIISPFPRRVCDGEARERFRVPRRRPGAQCTRMLRVLRLGRAAGLRCRPGGWDDRLAPEHRVHRPRKHNCDTNQPRQPSSPPPRPPTALPPRPPAYGHRRRRSKSSLSLWTRISKGQLPPGRDRFSQKPV